MEELVYLEKFRGWARPGTLDEYVFKEIRPSYNMLDIQKGDTVLDVGANIGAFSLYAEEQGASKIYAYEPDSDNFALLMMNSPNSINAQCAVVGDDSESVSLYINSKKNKGLHMTREVNGRDCVTVPALNFDKIIQDTKPNKIKIDVEGAEYGFMPYIFPEHVEKLVMEIHFQYDSTWRAKGRGVHDSMLEQGFKPMREFRDTGKNWHTIGAYTR
jgi:FkbM family methyltransferase